jgi:hypothetical protein
MGERKGENYSGCFFSFNPIWLEVLFNDGLGWRRTELNNKIESTLTGSICLLSKFSILPNPNHVYLSSSSVNGDEM